MNKKYSTFRLSAQAIADQGDVVRRISLERQLAGKPHATKTDAVERGLMIAGALARGEVILTTSEEMASICGGVIRTALLNSERPLIQSIYEAALEGVDLDDLQIISDGEGGLCVKDRSAPAGTLGDIGAGDLKTLADAIPTNKAAMN